jgi:hypothetical protein
MENEVKGIKGKEKGTKMPRKNNTISGLNYHEGISKNIICFKQIEDVDYLSPGSLLSLKSGVYGRKLKTNHVQHNNKRQSVRRFGETLPTFELLLFRWFTQKFH